MENRGEVVKEPIGEDFGGVLGSDFYAGYNSHQGWHQRCWVHFLRDGHELKEKYPHDQQLFSWAEQGPDQHLSARQQQQTRVARQHVFEQQLLAVCRPYVGTPTPLHTLCERVERFLPELFVFVAVPDVPAHYNLAERSIRPLVVARKISGGTRGSKGSQTRMGLASLFDTWMAQHLNPSHQCLATLTMKSSLGQV